MYDSRIGRRWELDPIPFANESQYSTFHGNPILYSDPTGKTGQSTHTDEKGNVVAVKDDGDKGVYKHKGTGAEAKKKFDQNYNEKNTSASGEKMGESLHSLSFANQNVYNKTGEVKAEDIKIDFGSTDLTGKVEAITSTQPSVLEYFQKAGGGGDWDIKSHTTNGSLLYGKYASPRDAGNFAAGIVAERSGIEPIVQFGFGAYNLTGNNKPLTAVVTAGVVYLTIVNKHVGLTTAYLIGKYGEDKLSQRSIDLGKNYAKQNK